MNVRANILETWVKLDVVFLVGDVPGNDGNV
jgi:hypothetical protein